MPQVLMSTQVVDGRDNHGRHKGMKICAGTHCGVRARASRAEVGRIEGEL